MQPCLSNYTIPRAVQLKTIVLYCRRKREISRAYQSSQKIFRVRRPFFDPPSFHLTAVISEFSDRRAPVLNHKSCWMAFMYFLIYMNMRRTRGEGSREKVLGDCKRILYILIISLHHSLLRD